VCNDKEINTISFFGRNSLLTIPPVAPIARKQPLSLQAFLYNTRCSSVQ